MPTADRGAGETSDGGRSRRRDATRPRAPHSCSHDRVGRTERSDL